jgi:Tn3 transposase DDE domain
VRAEWEPDELIDAYASSSEVAAMIEGLLRHGTDAEIEANYTDARGASLVGFAFTELLVQAGPAGGGAAGRAGEPRPPRKVTLVQVGDQRAALAGQGEQLIAQPGSR